MSFYRYAVACECSPTPRQAEVGAHLFHTERLLKAATGRQAISRYQQGVNGRYGVGGILGGDDKPLTQILPLVIAKEKLQAKWPIFKFVYPVSSAIAITRGVTDSISTFNNMVGKVATQSGFLSVTQLHSEAGQLAHKYAQDVGGCIAQAKKAGNDEATCVTLRAASIDAYEKLIDLYNRLGRIEGLNQSLVFSVVNSIKRGIEAVGEAVVEAKKAVEPFVHGAIDWLKIGALIAGGIIVAWFVVRR